MIRIICAGVLLAFAAAFAAGPTHEHVVMCFGEPMCTVGR